MIFNTREKLSKKTNFFSNPNLVNRHGGILGCGCQSLFQKTSIKGMELKNRLIRSATHEGMSNEKGFPTMALFNLYERLAKGGVGMIITEYTL